MIEVLHPGVLTLVQDVGRFGFQRFGVPVSGVMDDWSYRIANVLVGNDDQAAVLEISIKGPILKIKEDCIIALCGAEMTAILNQEEIPMWRPVYVPKDSVLSIKHANRGTLAYLAVSGGIQVPVLMKSSSTTIRSGLGGYNGRALQSGDILRIGPLTRLSQCILNRSLDGAFHTGQSMYASWFTHKPELPVAHSDTVIRVIHGREFEVFDLNDKCSLEGQAFEVLPQADRMGYRLRGSYSLSYRLDKPMLSEPVTMGTIQVPPDGEPIVLMADRQTTGGYPRVAQVISIDLPLLAQARPGVRIRFKTVSLIEAQQLLLQREKDLDVIRTGVQLKYLESRQLNKKEMNGCGTIH